MMCGVLLRGSRGSRLLACAPKASRGALIALGGRDAVWGRVFPRTAVPPPGLLPNPWGIYGGRQNQNRKCLFSYPLLPIGLPRVGMVSWGVQPHDMAQAPDPGRCVSLLTSNYFCLNVRWRSCSGREGGAPLKFDAVCVSDKK